MKATAMRNDAMMDMDPAENPMVSQPLKTMPRNRMIKTGTGILEEHLSCLGHKRVISSIGGIYLLQPSQIHCSLNTYQAAVS